MEGHFWQVDHIRPVYGGGGQCNLDNLQTLCTVCHREVLSYSYLACMFLNGNTNGVNLSGPELEK